jgi:cyclohexa-1,5-dienecarbonyl-CoA hydratase
MADLVRVRPHENGAYWHVVFGDGNGNILDAGTVGALSRTFADARETTGLKTICLDGAGENFSFGASVQEHLPNDVRRMLAQFRQLLFDLLESQVVVLAAVRGRCLGGGLELATLCHRVFAARDAQFGQPEIALGVFAPFASILLPGRIGRPAADELCLTGRIIPAGDAKQIGLVEEIVDGDPAEAAIAWARANLAAVSASSLRIAVKAMRVDTIARLREQLPAIEALYLDELMSTTDAVEGLKAFLEKRKPVWDHGRR